MTIYNFRCLYDILHHLEEYSACLVNFRYKVVYIFSRLQTILDVYLQIYSFMVSNFHICYYQYYSSGRVSPPFILCLYAMFGYKHFLTTITYSTAIYYLRQPYTTLDSYILLTVTINYFRQLYTTFDGSVLLSTIIYYFYLYLTVIL